jgi:hypothetical protein
MSLALTFKRLATSLLPEVLLVADIRDVSNAEVRYLSKWVDSKPTVLGFNVGVLAGLIWLTVLVPFTYMGASFANFCLLVVTV